MMFEELEQRDLKNSPEYRNVMLRADQHAEWLAGLARLCSPDHGLPLSSERTDTPTATKRRRSNRGTLRTIREACDYMTAMGKERELRQHWQRACSPCLWTPS
jgi:hypothetical protein